MLKHTHTMFPYTNGEGFYCIRCNLEISADDVQDLLNRHVNSEEPKHCTCKTGTGNHASWCELNSKKGT